MNFVVLVAGIGYTVVRRCLDRASTTLIAAKVE